MQVLVVDDEPQVRTLVRLVLEDAAIDVAEAGDATEALALCRSRDFAVVVLDIGLPGTSGLEVLRVLHDTQPGLPVIMLTGATGEDDRVLALDSGAHDYIVKPFSNRELLARVCRASAH